MLWGAASSPPGTTCASHDFLFPSKAASEGLRADYLSPEAVQGFTLQAYRPASLPVKKADPMGKPCRCFTLQLHALLTLC